MKIAPSNKKNLIGKTQVVTHRQNNLRVINNKNNDNDKDSRYKNIKGNKEKELKERKERYEEEKKEIENK